MILTTHYFLFQSVGRRGHFSSLLLCVSQSTVNRFPAPSTAPTSCANAISSRHLSSSLTSAIGDLRVDRAHARTRRNTTPNTKTRPNSRDYVAPAGAPTENCGPQIRKMFAAYFENWRWPGKTCRRCTQSRTQRSLLSRRWMIPRFHATCPLTLSW